MYWDVQKSIKSKKRLCAYVLSNKNYFTCRVMIPFASVGSYDPWQVFRNPQYSHIVRRKVSKAPKVSWSCSKTVTFCYVFRIISPSEWYERTWNFKNRSVLTFSQIKTISRVVWWCRLLLRIAMIPRKCLEAYRTVVLCVEKFLRHQKLVETVQKLLLLAMFLLLFYLQRGLKEVKTWKIAVCLRFLQ